MTGREDSGALRRAVRDQAVACGAAEEGCARAQLVATELATNLLQHAVPGGCIFTRTLPAAGIELIAVDGGPGIADPAAAIAGHGAVAQGLGCGLAAVRRASSQFDLHTELGQGTTVLSVIDLIPANRQGDRPTRRSVAAVSVGIAEPCGDAWAVSQDNGELAVAVVDGLGHGPAASAAADVAVAQFAATPTDLMGFVSRANAAMRDTRGAAVTVCRLRPGLGRLEYVTVGNVNGRVLGTSAQENLITYRGTLGMYVSPPATRLLTCPWLAGSTLVLWTDGLSDRVAALAPDAELLRHDPAVIAATLHRDHGRSYDDATVVVVRNPGA
ncbi:MAG TPA: SpoIIE family protein phosphatase [Streptosporangiaceae bacterium]|nr:SpoIIE family protein phosphatase [Streptosporangiaceae bacterium]